MFFGTSKPRWHRVAEFLSEIDFGPNGIAVCQVNGKTICLAKWKDEFFAFAYKCPHAGGILADGFIDALGNIVCPLHRYKYDPRNGRNVSGEGYYLKRWEVELREEGVFILM